MSKLIDAQLVLLSSAAQRPDRMVPPKNLEGRAATKILKPLLRNRFLEEVPAKNGYPIYRRDPDDGPIALRVTDKGLAVIGVEPEESPSSGKVLQEAAKRSSRKTGKPKPKVTSKATPPRAAGRAEKAGRSSGKPKSKPAGEPGAKRALLIEMLQKKGGANIDAIVKATGWLPHTGRAMISGLRKAGFKIETERAEDGKTVYRIAGKPSSKKRA